MGATRIAFARATARAGVLGSIAAVVFLLSGFGTGIVDALAGASTSGLREGLVAATGTDGAARWQIRVARDPEAQAEAAASVLDRMLVPHGVQWSRSVETAPVDAVHDGTALGAVLLADDGVPGRSELVSGSWPDDAEARSAAADAAATPAALHAAAAATLGIAVGDLVELQDGDGPRRLLVVGTWQPLDPAEAAWFGEPVVATGAFDGGAGPFLVDDDALVDLPAATVVRWTALVDPAVMTPERATALRAAMPNVEPAMRADDAIGTDGLGTSGGLAATLDRLLAGLGAVRAIAPLPVLLIAFSGFAALDRLAALLGASRRGETVLLRARGASAWRLARDTAVEVLVVGVPAAVLGAVAAEGLLALLRPGEARAVPVAVLAASVALAGSVLLVAGRAWHAATRPVVRGAGDEVGRMPRAAVAGGVVLVAVAAAVSLWQFRLYGSPLVPSASGALEVDVVAVLAPVLVLLALSLAALGLARPIGMLLERASGTASRAGARPADAPAGAARRPLLVGVARGHARRRRTHARRRVRRHLARARRRGVRAAHRRRRARDVRRGRPGARRGPAGARRPLRRRRRRRGRACPSPAARRGSAPIRRSSWRSRPPRSATSSPARARGSTRRPRGAGGLRRRGRSRAAGRCGCRDRRGAHRCARRHAGHGDDLGVGARGGRRGEPASRRCVRRGERRRSRRRRAPRRARTATARLRGGARRVAGRRGGARRGRRGRGRRRRRPARAPRPMRSTPAAPWSSPRRSRAVGSPPSAADGAQPGARAPRLGARRDHPRDAGRRAGVPPAGRRSRRRRRRRRGRARAAGCGRRRHPGRPRRPVARGVRPRCRRACRDRAMARHRRSRHARQRGRAGPHRRAHHRDACRRRRRRR